MRKSPKIPRSDTGAARELEKIRITGWTKNNEKGTKVCRLREGWEEAAMSGMEGEGGGAHDVGGHRSVENNRERRLGMITIKS